MKDNKKINRAVIGISIIVVCIIIIICSFGKIFNLDKAIKNNTTTTTTKASSSTNVVDDNKDTKVSKEVIVTDKGIADAVEKLYDSTVIVELANNKGQVTGWGSGFVYKTDDKYGYILTNAHVVDEAEKIKIVFSNESSVDGTVVGYDTYSDVGVVKVPVNSVIATASISNDTSSLRVGDTIFAIGTPISLDYSFTVTRGILSGKNRLVEMTNSSSSIFGISQGESWYMSLYQIDASINSGNSGGPLANANGEVIGITNSKLSTGNSYYSTSASIENIGFAIPIEDALTVASQLISKGKVERPSIGISMTDVEYAARNGIILDSSITEGAVIVNVSSDGAAAKAGIKSGDVIVKIDAKKVKNYKYLKYYLYRYQAGSTINITVNRAGKEVNLKLLLK